MADEGAREHDPAGVSGNRARDHMANERTYLAWLRTALGILALAVAVAQFGPNDSVTATLSVIGLAVLGGLVLGIGTSRYYRVSVDLERERYVVARRGPLLLAAVVAVGAVVLLPILLWG